MSVVLRSAWRAFGLFLRGFTGIAPHCDLDHAATDSRTIRETLAAQAARRGRCC